LLGNRHISGIIAGLFQKTILFKKRDIPFVNPVDIFSGHEKNLPIAGGHKKWPVGGYRFLCQGFLGGKHELAGALENIGVNGYLG
jgi:hypothetical protein